MADTLLNAELLAACSALGYSDGAKYYKEPDCLETIKDLIRYLRKDDESHVIRRALGDTKVVQTDLIPIVCDSSDDKELFEVTLRLLVNLTNPVLLLFREELPEDKVTRNQFLQLLSQQQIYKEAFADDKVWAVLVRYLGNLLMLEWENRLEDDKLVVERILILIRNVLTVPANPETEKRTDDDASIHDQILWALHLAGFEDILLYICSSENEQDLCMHALEIISLMLKEQDPTQLARAGLERSHSEKEKDEKELMDIRKREIAEKQAKLKKFVGARHSRFGGSFCVKNMKGISDRELITHQPLKDLKSLNFDHCKEPKKTPKHRMPLKDQGCTRRSTLAIRLFLQELCFEFLKGAYNSIMYIVKDNLNRARAQEHDETYYLWAMKFFMEFNRQYKFQVELVSETISVQAFHYIQTQLEHYYEMMTTDKKKIPHWSRRMHKALRAYQELLLNLASMDKSENESVRESSRILKSKVFYVIEYRELVLILLQNYDELKMSNSYLKDLVETSHIFLKLLEQMCGKHRHLMVQKKSVKKKKKQKPKASEQGRGQITEEQLREQWDEMAEEMGVILQGGVELPDTIPFDAASELRDDEQKEASMRKINALLRKKELKEGISLLRSSREVWPEGDIFGAQDIDPTQEFLALEEIFMANLNPEEPKEPTEIIKSDEEEEEDEEEQTMEYVREQEFNFQEFVRRFANTRVMQSFYKLFRNFNNNSDYTNHCILKMYHRIGWDCKLPAMFFQASIFRIFQMAMEDPRSKSNGTIKEINKFARFILRKFFEVTETNKKVFVELLFWKTNKEALEIECGYGTSESTTRVKGAWNEEEEDELQRLYEEFKDTCPEGKDTKDAVDMIVQNLINQNRTRRMVIKKLKDLGLVTNIKELSRKPIKVRAPKTWTEEEEGELKMLFEEYKESMDPITMIMDNMIIQRPKHRVVEKILELGLVADKKELRKKRIKKNEKTKKSKKADIGFQFLMANQNSDDEGKVEESVDSLNSASDSSNSDGDENEIPQTQVYVPPVSTPGLITAALNQVIKNGMRESVQWISGILKEIADDREEDGDFEPIPLLAVTEESTAAMEDEAFQQLLKMIGIHPPVGHQEMFWRVPSRLTVEGLRKRVLYLKSGLEGQNLQDGNPDEPLEAPDVQKKSKKESSKNNTKVTRMRKRHYSNDKDNENKENKQMQDENKMSKPKANKPGKKRSKPEDSSDEDVPLSSIQSSGSGNHVVSEGDDVETMSVKKVGWKRTISDSEDDEPKASKKRAPSYKKAEGSVKKRKSKASGKQSAEEIQIDKEAQNFVGEMKHMTEEPLGDTQDLRLHLDTETQMLYGKTWGIKGNQTSYRSRIIDYDSDEDDIPLISQQAPKTIILEDSDNDSRKTVRKRIATIESDSD
ncbi:protein timeless homolog isoform X1 [Oratosquilla oratoria]|uniref:protein timeless homolog isoform X1 n=1 Tax=Oratosquilla oratoria TaxID=337810 RepID=UPI003F7681EF